MLGVTIRRPNLTSDFEDGFRAGLRLAEGIADNYTEAGREIGDAIYSALTSLRFKNIELRKKYARKKHGKS